VTFASDAVTVHEGVTGVGGVVLTRQRRTYIIETGDSDGTASGESRLGRGRAGGEQQNGERPQIARSLALALFTPGVDTG
jgi:hypothetical protein